jgi:hypothetical protein
VGYQGFFGYEKSLFSRAVNEVKVWTEKIVSGDSAFPQDVDMEISLFADTPPGKPIIVIELVNGNRDGRNDQGRNRQFLEQTLRNITRGASGIPELGGYQGERALSFMADSFVRRRDFTSDGREFAEPYKKRMNCTKRPVSATFVDAFVDLADRVVNSGP